MDPEKRKRILKFLALAGIIILIYFLLTFIYNALGLPSSEKLLSSAREYYVIYGYWVVFIAAVVEGALFINWYLPGSVVAALGVVFAKETGQSVLLMGALIMLGFFLTAILNYVIGRFGWYHVFMKLGLKTPLEKVESKITTQGAKVLLTTYIHPNFGALAATASGVLRVNFLKFFWYSLASIIFWNSLWGTLFYFFGSMLIKHVQILIIILLSSPSLWRYLGSQKR